MTRRCAWLIALVGAMPSTQAARPPAVTESIDTAFLVLPAREQRPRKEGLLRDEMRRLSHEAFDQRTKRYEALKTPDDISTYQRELKARLLESLGGFPVRTPLNGRVVGRIERDGIRVEKIIFESQPGFFVPALLYLPTSPAPHPIVLMPCGHSANGKAGYQQPAMTLARAGLAVFCFDPIGQGERRQIVFSEKAKADGDAVAPEATTGEHTILGVAPILLGCSLTTHMIWDGIRAIDYLETRPDLDVSRLGCAGNSGGGMMTSYLMALEPRIISAAAGCYVTTSRMKNESPGPGDAEQNIYAQYAYGLDMPDFLILHAPQPALICAATRDYVPILGAWEAFRQAKRIYTRLGFPERVDLVETDATHGFSAQLREGTARWMRRWLMKKDDAVVEQPAAPFSDRELDVTPTGQVFRLEGSRSLFDLNREAAARLRPERQKTWSALSAEERRRRVREIAGVRSWDRLPEFTRQKIGTVPRPGYRIEKLVILPIAGVSLPALHFVPDHPTGKVCLYLHGRGKHVDAGPGGPIEELVTQGAAVLVVDLRGIGETAMYPWRAGPVEVVGNNGAEYFVSYMLGRSFVGLRAEEVLLAAKAAAALHPGESRRLELIALEEAAIPALHAAALEPQLFSSTRLVRSIVSWERVLEAMIPRRQLEGAVHGALRAYDLPDLAAMAGSAGWDDPIDATGAGTSR